MTVRGGFTDQERCFVSAARTRRVVEIQLGQLPLCGCITQRGGILQNIGE